MTFLVLLVSCLVLQALGQDPSASDVIDEQYYTDHCVTNSNSKRCYQPLYNYPKCVPWFTDDCQTVTKKGCTEFDCKVHLFYLAVKTLIVQGSINGCKHFFCQNINTLLLLLLKKFPQFSFVQLVYVPSTVNGRQIFLSCQIILSASFNN